MHSAKTERDMGKKVTPAHDKIHVDKKLYAWEDVTNRRVQWRQVNHPKQTHGRFTILSMNCHLIYSRSAANIQTV